MPEENLQIEDQSGDRKYFSIIPHYITNHSSSNDQSLYLQMKRYAGEGGTCFASKRTLMEKMKVGKKALNKSFKYLIDHKWITFVGFKMIKTDGGEQKVAVYKVNDIWGLNNSTYSKGEAERTPLKVGLEEQGGGAERASKKNQYKEEKKDIDAKASLSGLSENEKIKTVDIGGVFGDIVSAKKISTLDPMNKVALRIRSKFSELCEKSIGIKPVEDQKSYQIILFALKKGGMTEEIIYDLFEEWFGLGKPDEDVIQITRALSGNQINSYKVRNNK